MTNTRKETRSRLLAERRAMPSARRRAASLDIVRRVTALLEPLAPRVVGLYWPIRAEPEIAGLTELLSPQTIFALPVIVERAAALEFHAWAPDRSVEAGTWGIPVPVERRRVEPDVLIVPLLGFDLERYRLGYGGGYYDRTLAAFDSRPLAIGVGFELGRLDHFEPEPHDIPMDRIVTEAELL